MTIDSVSTDQSRPGAGQLPSADLPGADRRAAQDRPPAGARPTDLPPVHDRPKGHRSGALRPAVILVRRRTAVLAAVLLTAGMVAAIGLSAAAFLSRGDTLMPVGGPAPIFSSVPVPAPTPDPPAAAPVPAPPAAPAALASADVAAAILPSVVSVLTSSPGRQGGGSGVLLSADGMVLTNGHVIVGADTLRVQFNDGTIVAATVVGSDTADDLAVIKAVGVTGMVPVALTPAAAPVRVGQPVLALGSPFGLRATVTEGIVSAVHRPVTTSLERGAPSPDTFMDSIQTDAALNPGSSGGPLVDMTGRVIGINSVIASTPSTSSGVIAPVGIGFSIPMTRAGRVAQDIIATGHAARADLGATVIGNNNENPLSAQPVIDTVTPGGGADRAGLKSGDMIVRVGDLPTDSVAAAMSVLNAAAPNSATTITYGRGGVTGTVAVTLGSVPAP